MDTNGLFNEIHFDDQGTVLSGEPELKETIARQNIRDMFVMVHGWNKDDDSARFLYRNMFHLLTERLGGNLSSTLALGVFWPSEIFAEDDPATAGTVNSAPTTASGPAQDFLHSFPREADPNAKAAWYAKVKASVQEGPAGQYDEDAPLTRPQMPDLDFDQLALHVCGDTEGVVRIFTYHTMKNRAGVVGQEGLGRLIDRLSQFAPTLRVHLIGHSFGARLVAHTLAGITEIPHGYTSPVKSLVMIQGAFSHSAFAPPSDPNAEGSLSGLTDRVDGPLLATYTRADRALSDWYPLATMVQHDDFSVFDGALYRWGAMGHDGFQQIDALTMPLKSVGDTYNFVRQGFYKLDANSVINAHQSPLFGAHSDICHPEVLWAAVSAAGLDGQPQ